MKEAFGAVNASNEVIVFFVFVNRWLTDWNFDWSFEGGVLMLCPVSSFRVRCGFCWIVPIERVIQILENVKMVVRVWTMSKRQAQTMKYATNIWVEVNEINIYKPNEINIYKPILFFLEKCEFALVTTRNMNDFLNRKINQVVYTSTVNPSWSVNSCVCFYYLRHKNTKSKQQDFWTRFKTFKKYDQPSQTLKIKKCKLEKTDLIFVSKINFDH